MCTLISDVGNEMWKQKTVTEFPQLSQGLPHFYSFIIIIFFSVYKFQVYFVHSDWLFVLDFGGEFLPRSSEIM